MRSLARFVPRSRCPGFGDERQDKLVTLFAIPKAAPVMSTLRFTTQADAFGAIRAYHGKPGSRYEHAVTAPERPRHSLFQFFEVPRLSGYDGFGFDQFGPDLVGLAGNLAAVGSASTFGYHRRNLRAPFRLEPKTQRWGAAKANTWMPRGMCACTQRERDPEKREAPNFGRDVARHSEALSGHPEAGPTLVFMAGAPRGDPEQLGHLVAVLGLEIVQVAAGERS